MVVNRHMKLPISIVSALIITVSLPAAASAWVEYGAWYHTPAPHSQAYYQPMYAYSYAPAQSSQSTYINYPQNNYSYGWGAPSYAYPQQPYMPYAPQYSYAPYGSNYNMYGQQVPYSYGYPTGETVPLIGGQLCDFPDYDGRALCGSNPNQRIYDHWTGTWY